MPRTQKFSASEEFISWAQSLSAMLTKLEQQYGGIVEMVESPAWDEGRTTYALALVNNLHTHIARFDAELSIHVEEKTGQKSR
jgi:hypothetical protein